MAPPLDDPLRRWLDDGSPVIDARPGEPQSNMIAGMAAPIPPPPPAPPADWFTFLHSMPDTSGPPPGPPIANPAAWDYDFNPATGSSRATYRGELSAVGPIAISSITGPLTITGTTTINNGGLVLTGTQSGITFGTAGLFQAAGSFLMRVTAAAIGGVINVATDGVFKFFNRDGVTPADIECDDILADDITADAITCNTINGSPVAPQAVLQEKVTQTAALQTVTTLIPFDDTIPQITEGTEILSLAFTPISATSRLYFDVLVCGACGVATTVTVALFQDAIANALAASGCVPSGVANYTPIPLGFSTISGSTTARTYRVRVGPNAAATFSVNGSASVRVYGGVAMTYLRIRESAP